MTPSDITPSGFTTPILHADRRGGTERGAVHQPLHPSSEYAFSDARELAAVFQGKSGFSYARQGTPTTAALEAKLTQMEGGLASVSFASGMAALSAVFFTLLKQGDHLIASQYIFGNTNSLLMTLAGMGVEVTLVDATDVKHVQTARQPNTRMVFVETIANPGTQIADLAAIGAWCREQNLVYVLDNTLTTPWLCRGADMGAALVVNSLSKYVAGHGHALGGMVTETGCYDWQHYPNIAAPYRQGNPATWGLTQIKKKGLRDMGAALSADAAHRIAVGAETLALRMRQACDNALILAQTLAQHPKVARVNYPGLPDHPQHQRATQWFGGQSGTHKDTHKDTHYGALLAVTLDANIDVFEFLNHLQVFVLATHLGDTRTLVLPVAHTIYFEMGAERRALMGIADNLLRISVGIEDVQDLMADFNQAIEKV